MLAIKLRNVGKKRQRSYRLVVLEKRSKLQGQFVEDLGWYNPHTKEANLKNDRISYWVGVGAQPTDTVHNLLLKNGVIQGEKRIKHNTPPKKEEEAQSSPASGTAEVGAVKAESPAAEGDKPADEPKQEEKPAEEPKKEEASTEADKPAEEPKKEEPKSE